MTAPQAPAKGQIRTAHGRRSPCGERQPALLLISRARKPKLAVSVEAELTFAKVVVLSLWPTFGHVLIHFSLNRTCFY